MDFEGWGIMHLVQERIRRRRQRNRLRLYRRQLRDSLNPFELREVEFRSLFRMGMRMAFELCEALRPNLEGQRSHSLPVHIQVLVAVRFFATGSYQRAVAQDFVLAVCQTAAGNCVRQVSQLLSGNLAAHWIRFPQTYEERERVRRQFVAATGFPGVIGCIDCSHIAIVRPTANEAAYFNHNRFHSINVQVVSSYDLRILHIDPRMPGSVHDQFVFRFGNLREALEQQYARGLRNCWLLGDSAYVPEPYLLTPIRSAEAGSAEERYTRAHCSTRNCVERLFGVMKTEWRCLLKDRVLHYSPLTAGRIIVSCAVLNNMMRHYRILEPDVLVDEHIEILEGDVGEPAANALNVRAQVVQRHFQN